MSDFKNPDSGPERRPSIIKKKPLLSGHESFLKALEAAGAIVTVLKTSGETKKGTIKTSDKYTISLKETRADGSYQVYVIFKHAIEEYWTDPRDNPRSE